MPYKILDAPSLLDDYYLNLLDWSSDNNIGIGLDNVVYIWSATNNKAYKAYSAESNEFISSLSWSENSRYLAIGESQGNIKLFDAETHRLIADIPGHSCRVSSLAWNDWLLSSGSRDKTVLHRDIRCP